MWFLLVAYLASASCVLFLNIQGEAFRVRELLEAAKVAVIWPLVLLPWRQWLSSSQPGRHSMTGARA